MIVLSAAFLQFPPYFISFKYIYNHNTFTGRAIAPPIPPPAAEWKLSAEISPVTSGNQLVNLKADSSGIKKKRSFNCYNENKSLFLYCSVPVTMVNKTKCV